MIGITTCGTGVMERLRAETSERHKRAEEHQFQRSLLSGKLSRAEYARWLGQMWIVHRELERAIESAKTTEPRLTLAAEGHKHSESLEKDLATIGAVPADLRTMPGAEWVCGRIAAHAKNAPLNLLGMNYVLEGSMNGNRYIAIAVRRGLGFEPGQADRYLDPYGERQRPVWAEYKAAMSEKTFSVAEIDAMVAAAAEMFDGVAKISDDLADPA